MTDQSPIKDENTEKQKAEDSLGIPLERSPWTLFAMLQIPLVLIMIIVVIVLYQSQMGNN